MTKLGGQLSGKLLARILTIYILLQPLLDLLTALSLRLGGSVTAGTVVRMLFLLFALLAVLASPAFPHRRLCLAFLAAAAAYLLCFFLTVYRAGGTETLLANLRDSGKMLFVPVVAVFLYALRRGWGVKVSDRAVALAGAIYAFSILLAVLTGTSQSSYRTGFGFKGWFYAANEVSSILAVAGPLTVCLSLEQLRKDRRPGAVLAAAAALLSVAFCASYLGTKTVFAMLGLYCLLAALWWLVRALRKKGEALRAAAAAAMAALTLLLFLTSPLNSYLDSIYFTRVQMDTDAVTELLGGSGDAAEETEVNETLAALAEESEGTWLRAVITEHPAVEKLDQLSSRRLLNAAPAVEEFRQGSWLTKLFGVGYANASGYARRVDFMIELDGLAMLIRHGIVGFALFFLPYVLVMLRLIAGFFRRPRAVLGSLPRCTRLYSALAAFAISLLAGHVLTAPAVGIFMLSVTAAALEKEE